MNIGTEIIWGVAICAAMIHTGKKEKEYEERIKNSEERITELVKRIKKLEEEREG